MKKFFWIVFIFFSILPLSVRAATIKNTDNKPYSLLVKQENRNFYVLIDSNGTIVDLCQSCIVEVVGFSLLDIESEQNLFIRNGILTVQ